MLPRNAASPHHSIDRGSRRRGHPSPDRGPALVSVAVERQELSMPPKVEAKQAAGFAVYALRTVLAGNGRELIDLARTNARQLL
ncbi:hypothetical protein E6C64_01215 [Naasia lichenicola]|uniref:Uncharacterized protein n=1 Tax=Naasia lichenicola TaxID=2565933 RepID=A0A4S4FRL5_9MICO|nr:hypothetical protein E6C64_01215 [Naasia lichenicola]